MKNKSNIYGYLEYRDIILDLVKIAPARGKRKELAEALGCQMSFLTQVLNGTKDFNHEQGLKVCRFLNFSEVEEDYFLDLISFARAGTKELKNKIEKKLMRVRTEQGLLKNRLSEADELDEKDKAIYYSDWSYAAVHMAVTIPTLRNIQRLSEALQISVADLQPIVKFLSDKKLITMERGSLEPGTKNIFISKDSPLVVQHHQNWRGWLMPRMKFEKPDDLHYSLCFSIAEKDLAKVKEVLVTAINDALEVIRPSPEEKLSTMTIDLTQF
ncbi:TIGR02147 family protein [Bdellovibrio sp. HCB290]|uniref:TIGR02147 family protein n=1 Tax=Bdellovibrio sp. HCB290 TaxID=3394356 RepID=UPI0039B384CF